MREDGAGFYFFVLKIVRCVYLLLIYLMLGMGKVTNKQGVICHREFNVNNNVSEAVRNIM